jgi:uncharacterized protein (DUF1330 family)
MKRQITTLLALIAGVGISVAAVQGLHAQTKPKAYGISEVEILDRAALDAFAKVARPAVQAAGGQVMGTVNEKIIKRVGEAPKAVILVEWDSLEKAEAYLKSPTYTNFIPQRDKSYKISALPRTPPAKPSDRPDP